MPNRAPRPCNHAGCANVGHSTYCNEHVKKRQQQQDKARGTASQRGYGTKWKKARLAYLQQNPLCVRCNKEGILKAANVVDHKIPHKGDSMLMWDSLNNWQSLCKQCHDIKTATEDGGFGR